MSRQIIQGRYRIILLFFNRVKRHFQHIIRLFNDLSSGIGKGRLLRIIQSEQNNRPFASY